MSETVPIADVPPDAHPYAPVDGEMRAAPELDPTSVQAYLKEAAEEIEARGGSPASFLNNLADNLPGGRRRTGKALQIAQKHPDVFGPDAPRHHDTKSWSDERRAQHSERMLGITNGGFVPTSTPQSLMRPRTQAWALI